MTRKRYVKLLMACGMGRNLSKRAASFANVNSGSYLRDMYSWLRIFENSARTGKANNFCSRMRKATRILRQALKEGEEQC